MKPLTTTELIIEFLNGNIEANETYISTNKDKLDRITAYFTTDGDKALEIEQFKNNLEIDVTRMKLQDYSTDSRLWEKK